MKNILFLGALVATSCTLVSCNPQPVGMDGYSFEKGTQYIGPREILVVKYPDFTALRSAYAKQPGGRELGISEELQAFTIISSSQCTIHMIDPAVDYQPEFFGHELVHCMYGNFHPRQDSVRSANHLN